MESDVLTAQSERTNIVDGVVNGGQRRCDQTTMGQREMR